MGKIVLVWAWWTGMSGIAGILQEIGYTNIVCIDANQSQLTDKLKAQGLKVIIGHGKHKIQLGDVVIYSEATAESPEVLEARNIMKANKKVMVILNYFQFLGELSKYFVTIGFTGTNGKSSSTALAIHTAKKLLPNFGIGILWALVPSFHTQSYTINHKAKKDIKTIFDYIFTGKWSSEIFSRNLLKSWFFFVEACEYKRHFLYLDLDYAIITSLELDHTDYYKDMKDYVSAFQTLISKTKYKVFVPQGLKACTPSSHRSLIPSKIKQVPIKKIPFTHIRGKHNDLNGSLVLALLQHIGKKPQAWYRPTLAAFKGLRRRMEYLTTTKNKAKIFTDYGHMASSIQLGYMALKAKFPDKKLMVIFQPHQINRIVTGWTDFINAMQPYDHKIIFDIYAARENLQQLTQQIPALKNIHTIKELGEKFASACTWTYSEDFATICSTIQQADKNTIIVIYSAGDIDYKLRQYLKI